MRLVGVRVLGTTIAKNDLACAEAVSAWSQAENLWQARSSVVAFVPVSADNRYYPLIYKSCPDLMQRDERFAKTAVGWILRDLSKHDRQGVKDVVEGHLGSFSVESIRNALKYFPDNERDDYVQRLKAINGLVVGGAFTMCLSCADLIYASEHAWAQLPFVNIGIIPELASSYLLPRLLGFQRAKELIYFGERIPAQQLFELGLVNKVVPHDQLIPYAKEMALRLIPPAGAWMAIRAAKRALHRPLLQEVTEALDKENEGLNQAFGTEDFREALKARAEKRPPVFRGQ